MSSCMANMASRNYLFLLDLRTSLMYLTAISQEIMTYDVFRALFEAVVTIYGALTRASGHDGSPQYARATLVHMDVRASNATTTSK